MDQRAQQAGIGRRDFVRLTGGLIAAGAVTGAASADPSDDWPQPRADAGRTASTVTSGPKDDAQTRWSTSGSDSGVVVGDCVYIGDSGAVRAFRLVDGSNRWTVQTEGFIVGLSATNETVYVAVGGEWTGIIALSTTDGTERWRKELLQPRYAPIISDELYVIVEEADSIDSDEFEGSLLSLSAADGTVRWEHPLTLDSEGPSAPAVANGTVYIGGSDIIAVDTDGEEIWRNPDGGHNLAVAHGTVYVSFSPGLRALSASDGSEQWEYVVTVDGRSAEDAHASAPAISDETVYFGLTDHAREGAAGIYALSTTDGSEQWTTPGLEGSVVVGAPAVADDVLYSHEAGFADFPSERGTVEGGTVFALDATDGTRRWESNTGAEESVDLSGLIVTQGLVLIERFSILAGEHDIVALEETGS